MVLRRTHKPFINHLADNVGADLRCRQGGDAGLKQLTIMETRSWLWLADAAGRRGAATVLILILALSGCATPPPVTDVEARQEYEQQNDPLEPANRAVFAFNKGLDEVLFQPLARTYRAVLPVWMRARIGSAIDNLRAPVIFFNDLLQGEAKRAVTTALRFGFNTTLGLGGINDIAAEIGYKKHGEDFGQTLAVWGSDSGPYLMLPVLGPSNPRDVVGRIVDFLVDPFNAWAANTGGDAYVYARAGVTALHERAELLNLTDDLEKTSLDLYAAVRSLYRQHRADVIGNGVGAGAKQSSGSTDFPNWLPAAGDGEISGRP